MKEHAQVTVPVALVVALIGAGGYTKIEPLLFGEHTHPVQAEVLTRLAQAEQHITDPRPHPGADDRIRALENSQAVIKNTVTRTEAEVQDLKRQQEQTRRELQRGFEALMERLPRPED